MAYEAHEMQTTSAAGAARAPGAGHIVSVGLLAGVLLVLLGLTYVTVHAIDFDLGRLNILIALAIATIKAVLVALYFMHLRWDRPFNAVVLLSALFFVALLVGLTMMDTKDYRPAITAYRQAAGENENRYAPGLGRTP